MFTALALLAPSCAGPRTPAQVHPGQQPPTKGPSTEAERQGTPVRLGTVEGLLIGTPIYDGDFADPFVLAQDGTAFAYATNTVDANVPVLQWIAQDSGRYLGDALPELPAWTSKGLVWAPAVWARPDGTYVLYYTTVDNASKKQCLSRATASNPAGPFTDGSAAAFVCPLELGGAIDPGIFVTPDGVVHLLYKNDGNCCGLPTSIWSVPLSSDGLSPAGEPTRLITADQPWEGGLIEGPSMVSDGGTFYLFYSANAWNTAHYAIGYAICQSLQGPCTKPQQTPWMDSTTFAKGPGGEEFFSTPSGVWMVYHGWAQGQVGAPDAERRLYLDGLTVEAGTPERIGREVAEAALARVLVPVALAVAALAALAWWGMHRRRRGRRGEGPLRAG